MIFRIVLSLAMTLTISLIASAVEAQGLNQVYRAGRLAIERDDFVTPDSRWQAANDDWDAEVYSRPVGRIKSMAVAGDGSMFICSRSGYHIDKLDHRGRLVTSFGEEGRGGFQYRPTLHGVLDDEYVIVTEHNGRLWVYDTDGHKVKRIQLDYMPLWCEPMRDGVVAVLGHVAWGGGKVRYIVSMLDIHDESEDIIDSRIVDRSGNIISVDTKSGQSFAISTQDYTNSLIAATPDRRRLVVGRNDEDFIVVFSLAGEKLHTCRLDYERKRVTQQKRTDERETLKAALQRAGVDESQSESVVGSIKPAEFQPYYYNLMVDPEGNILLFQFTDDRERVFRAYSPPPACTFIGEVRLSAGDVEFSLTARHRDLLFTLDGLYGVGFDSTDDDFPTRIIRKKF